MESVTFRGAVRYSAQDLRDLARDFDRRSQSDAASAGRMLTLKDRRFYEGQATAWKDAAAVLRTTTLASDGPALRAAAEFGYVAHEKGKSPLEMQMALTALSPEAMRPEAAAPALAAVTMQELVEMVAGMLEGHEEKSFANRLRGIARKALPDDVPVSDLFKREK